MAEGRTLESTLGPYTDDFLVSMKAGAIRAHEQELVHTPSTDPYDEPAHGEVVGEKKKPRSRRTRFREASTWEIEPPEDFEPPTQPKG